MRRIYLSTLLILLGIGAVLGGAYATGYVPLPIQAAGNKTDAETTLIAEAGAAAPEPQLGGSIIADAKVVPVTSADLGLTSSGIVVNIAVREGDEVKPGQLVLQLDPKDVQVAIAQANANLLSAQARYDELRAGAQAEDIEAARAGLAAAQARLDKLTLSTENGDIAALEATVAGAQANLQQVLDGSSEQQLIEARANLHSAEAERKRAQSAYNLVKWRNDLGATKESADLQRATIAYEAAQARLTDLENGATQSQIAAASAQVRQNQAQLNALRNSRPADIAVLQADVRNAQAQLDKLLSGTRPEQLAQAEASVAAATAALQQQLVAMSKLELRAPFTGTVASLDVTLGEQVSPGVPVLRLADLEQLQLETEDLTELQVVLIQEGDAATVSFDAIPDLTMTGTVTRIRPFGETSSGDIVYRATIALPQADPRLRWNMTAVVTFGE
ncbi:MAG: HlyD family secretion protein [Caldilineaceae bacterium]